MKSHFGLTLILFFALCSLRAQSTFLIGAGYEFNSIEEKLPERPQNTEFVVPADFPLSAWTINLLLGRQITTVSSLNLSAIYSQHRYIGFHQGNFDPMDEFGFRRLSLRPAYAYGKGAWQGSIGGDVSVLFQHFHGRRGVKRNALYAKRPELFNIQFGLSTSLGYEWKRFVLQGNTSIGLFYKEDYVEYLSTFNTYGLSLFYRVVGPKP